MAASDAPISRNLVDEALPWGRAFLGIAFVAYSANATIRICAEDLIWLFDTPKLITIGAFPDAYWYSSVLAVILFGGEVFTSERYPRTYRIFLVPDAFYTGRQIFDGLSRALSVLAFAAIGDETIALWIGWLLAFPVAAVIGTIVAKWGEILIFGKRRRPRSKQEA